MTTNQNMMLGAFSVSLAVKDLAVSKAFYQKIGFEPIGGNGKNWLILRNGTTTIGLFHGMFEKNVLTFNPGWDWECKTLESFVDVRELQRRVRANGIEPTTTADDSATGPGSFIVVDPAGNPILVDQHV